MLEIVDLDQKIDKETYKPLKRELTERLYFLQQEAWTAGIPVIIIFEGWDAAGKGTTINRFVDPIDPRGYRIFPIRAARTFEKKHPWLWRFWLKTPARGEWVIFDRSWYGRVLVERMEKLVTRKEWEQAYQDIVDFERNLADDGTLIIKFLLHISKKEQKKRFQKLVKDPLTEWKVTEEDWRNHERYKKWLAVYQEMLEQTETEWGPWTVVEATDRRYTLIKVFRTVINALEGRLGSERLGDTVEPSIESESSAELSQASEQGKKPESVSQPAVADQPEQADQGGKHALVH